MDSLSIMQAPAWRDSGKRLDLTPTPTNFPRPLKALVSSLKGIKGLGRK